MPCIIFLFYSTNLDSPLVNILPYLLSLDLFSEPFEVSCRHRDTLLRKTIPYIS